MEKEDRGATFTQSTRRTQRYAARFSVSVIYDGQIIHGMTQNVSLGGMYIELEESTAMFDPADLPGISVTVSFEVPGQPGDRVVEAEVRWSDQVNGIGVQFTDLGDAESKALEHLFQRAPKVGPPPISD